jgi:hypothetical protein
MWRFLALRICSVAGVLNECSTLSEAAAIKNWERRDAAPGVVGHQDKFSGLIYRDVARIRTFRGNLIEQR